ncbi:hypothetical protein ACH5A3_42795 [Streptomyces echinatus]|uniref:hypothetical protein n=1 Tax=Streptomyces echinatus TaxID=67293 RepID=UPI0037B5EC7B
MTSSSHQGVKPVCPAIAPADAGIGFGEQLSDDARRIGSRSRTIAEDFALEQPLLMPLPKEPFETGRLFTPRVDRYGQIPVRTNRYSAVSSGRCNTLSC